ncbi:MAG: TAXI family TRAP transporter solute-binding subunit [Alphaproteobacteria bacterium]|nr:TAXI family TRAP transporter solute-binding subunit [Alphaproteobacteria bacterium]
MIQKTAMKSATIASLFGAALLAGAAAIALPEAARADTRVTLKSATSSSSYYVMIVQIGEALKEATGGKIQATIEESQGSVQNVKEAARRPGNFVFTTPPSLLKQAQAGQKPFEGETGYDKVRALFVMPFVTIHLVVRADSGVAGAADLAGKDFIGGGKGTFCEGRTKTVLKLLGLEGKVNLVDVELASADAAVKNRKVAGYATCSSHPTPQVQELATTTAIRIISFTPDQLSTIIAQDASSGPVTIKAGTYKGLDQDVQTVGVPVGAYATTNMDDETAYQITKAFWSKRAEMAKTNPWWNGINPDMVAQLGSKLHPGAARYYKEAGIKLPESMM